MGISDHQTHHALVLRLSEVEGVLTPREEELVAVYICHYPVHILRRVPDGWVGEGFQINYTCNETRSWPLYPSILSSEYSFLLSVMARMGSEKSGRRLKFRHGTRACITLWEATGRQRTQTNLPTSSGSSLLRSHSCYRWTPNIHPDHQSPSTTSARIASTRL